ncbi:6-phosphogluconolactonase [Candidatus Fukatsuia symbiotica]|uniref:6-phosphogluconolactonase n=1 Tax=Candidatus Fukatsuia symbiotica TaxID=1878942 RepID=A0A2U8I687_9GAMM|nr:6-phosphogluconolactonase [Candidatus Fukatsuia symbiotica]AWK14686.1 6-phosphogluconolactonase [Candidatus Fukatsuia symbiotica]MEA9445009.1 6-phosphogluconolactonase [Candidatus Fukatsuia symbiotica]
MKQIVYVASPNSSQIDVWQLNLIGELTLLQTERVSDQQVQPMVISPDKRYLYVGVRPDFAILTYRITDDGRLKKVASAALPGSPTHISTDLQGRFLFSASYNANCVSVSPIDNQGVVKKWIQQLDDLKTPHSANIDLGNQLVLVPCLEEDRICLFKLSTDGKLTPHKQQKEVKTAKGAGPRHMAFHPHHQVAYCVNERNSTVDVYQITDNGQQYRRIQTLNALPTDFTGTCWAADIHITPDGRYLYISDRTASTLAIFSIEQEGTVISLIGHQPTETQPRGFNIDHSGDFLIAAGQQSDHIAVYGIDEHTGKLTLLARYPVGKGPMWVTVLALRTCSKSS